MFKHRGNSNNYRIKTTQVYNKRTAVNSIQTIKPRRTIYRMLITF